MNKLFALLVGIDAYPAPVPPLRGCVNDITAMLHYLRQHEAARGQLQPRILLNQDATRQAMIDGFDHLHQAGPGDVALFYYSGHGSQEMAAPEFWRIEPDHRNETLVCWDSRRPGGWDLADKELGFLLHRVAQTGAHLVVLLDSCHSGSATRDAEDSGDVRWQSTDRRLRPTSEYLFPPEFLQRYAAPTGAIGAASRWLELPEARHVLLAACADHETAKEITVDGSKRGAFSYYLLEALQQTGGQLTYRDLFNQARARLINQVSGQTPQLEATLAEDIELSFLSGAVTPRPRYFTVHHDRLRGWLLNGGMVHGLQAPQGKETTWLALYPGGADLQTALAEQALAQATITQTLPGESLVSVQDEAALDPQLTYKALVMRLPLPPLEVLFEGDEDGLALARTALQTCGLDGGASMYVREGRSAPGYRLLARDGEYRITLTGSDRPLTEAIPDYTRQSADLVVFRLEHIARWRQLLDLRNPTCRLPAGAVTMTISVNGEVGNGAAALAEYSFRNGKWERPTFTLNIRSHFPQQLYCALIDLPESFAIEAPFFPAGYQELPPYGEVSTPVKRAAVPDSYWNMGITERRDVFKLVASTAPLDARSLRQGALPPYIERGVKDVDSELPQGALNRLFRRLQTREIEDNDAPQPFEDWTTAEVVLTVRRPLYLAPVPASGEAVPLGAGVTLEPHPVLQGRARLVSLPQAERDLAHRPLPPILEASQPLYFQSSRGADPGLSALELADVPNARSVTPAAPLRLNLTENLADGEQVLPVAFDGEFYLPLGYASRSAQGTQIVIQRLPEPLPLAPAGAGGERDINSTIRIYLQKIVSQVLPLPYPYPLLAAVEVGDQGDLVYEFDARRIKERVAGAQRITLFIHGFSGETRTLLPTARQVLVDDLLLAFDYESLNTPVEENARKLKARLQEVGLGPGHGKALHIVAHSLGGIVARWFIEQVPGGNQMVQQATLLGAPNAGTPWPTVQQWATVGISLALNSLTAVAWPLKTLGWLLNTFETVDVALDQVQPGSDLLDVLAESEDPHVLYTLIAGNTSLVQSVSEGGEASRLAEFMQRLSYGLAALPFCGQANDIAVSVKSAHAVDAQRSPAPEKLVIGCDHLSFFDSPAGLAALRTALE